METGGQTSAHYLELSGLFVKPYPPFIVRFPQSQPPSPAITGQESTTNGTTQARQQWR